LVSILGEQMISDSVVGLLELVKNAYDADAAQVTVDLKGLGAVETTTIVVQDDGFGMSASDVVNKFLSPAFDHKARAKNDRVRSAKGRLPIGEKGVGRFAVQQLGRRLVLVTRAAGHPEVMVDINWDAFEDSDSYLSDIDFPVTERDPEVFVGSSTGTRLEIHTSRSAWGELEIKKLHRGLRRLQSPHSGDASILQDFTIRFVCPEFERYESLDPGDILDHSHYVFRAVVDESGTMFFNYRASHPAVTPRTREDEASIGVAASGELAGSSPTCGPFYINLYVWDRTPQYLQAAGASRADLDAMSGVSLFRDGLRVLPYGEAGDDWLQLDRDRINNPSERIGNNQVIGFIEVSQAETPGLRDKTNREGLIENPAFRDLRALSRAAIAFFNTLWLQDRPSSTRIQITDGATASGQLQNARSVASALHSTSRDDIAVELPITRNSDSGTLATIDDAPELVSQREASKRLIRDLDKAIALDKAEDSALNEQREVLMHLAATGMAAERVVHEFGRQVVAALAAIEELRAGNTSGAQLGVLASCLGTLRNEFRSLAPYEGVSRHSRTVPVSIRDVIEVAVLLNRCTIEEKGLSTTVLGQDFSVLGRQSSIIQVFDNLIHNASHWAGGTGGVIRLEIDSSTARVSVSDSGPGIAPGTEEVIFDPFVTTRPGGRGLGLYISRMLMSDLGGTIGVKRLDRSDLPGATFVVDFGRAQQK
jgi:hypothetical protein